MFGPISMVNMQSCRAASPIIPLLECSDCGQCMGGLCAANAMTRQLAVYSCLLRNCSLEHVRRCLMVGQLST